VNSVAKSSLNVLSLNGKNEKNFILIAAPVLLIKAVR
jgi:hypothetical protein